MNRQIQRIKILSGPKINLMKEIREVTKFRKIYVREVTIRKTQIDNTQTGLPIKETEDSLRWTTEVLNASKETNKIGLINIVMVEIDMETIKFKMIEDIKIKTTITKVKMKLWTINQIIDTAKDNLTKDQVNLHHQKFMLVEVCHLLEIKTTTQSLKLK